MIIKIITTCIITALVSSNGPAINVNHLRYIQDRGTECDVYQYYNPSVIHSDWSCAEVEQSIMYAIQIGCKNNS